MKKLLRGTGGVVSAIALICYLAAHIIAAVALFTQVKLWAFLVMLCVPVLGDVMAVICLIKTATWFPFILYGAYLALIVVGSLLDTVAEE